MRKEGARLGWNKVGKSNKVTDKNHGESKIIQFNRLHSKFPLLQTRTKRILYALVKQKGSQFFSFIWKAVNNSTQVCILEELFVKLVHKSRQSTFDLECIVPKL